MAEFRLDDDDGHQVAPNAHQRAEQAPQQAQVPTGPFVSLPSRNAGGRGPLVAARFGGGGLVVGGLLAALALALAVLSIFGGGDGGSGGGGGDKSIEHIEDTTPDSVDSGVTWDFWTGKDRKNFDCAAEAPTLGEYQKHLGDDLVNTKRSRDIIRCVDWKAGR